MHVIQTDLETTDETLEEKPNNYRCRLRVESTPWQTIVSAIQFSLIPTRYQVFQTANTFTFLFFQFVEYIISEFFRSDIYTLEVDCGLR